MHKRRGTALTAVALAGALALLTPISAVASDDALRAAFDAIPGGGAAKVTLLTDNPQAWATRWWLLSKASKTIDTTYFILDKDVFGMAFLGHLLKKGSEGCKIRLMVDARGTKGLARTGQGQDYLQELIDVGKAEIRVYSPYYKGITNYVGQTAKRIFTGDAASTAVVASNHDKIVVADGEWALTGGRNISLNYFLDPVDFPEVFRDTDVLIHDTTVSAELARGFEEEFLSPNNFTVSGNLMGRLVKRDLELLGAFRMMDQWLRGEPFPQAQAEALRTDEAAKEAMAEKILQDVEGHLDTLGIERDANCWDRHNMWAWALELAGYPLLRGMARFDPTAAAIEADGVKIIDRGSSQGKLTDGIQGALVSMVKAARQSIVIQNPYVVLTDKAVEVLAEAGRRGVQITVVTNSPVSTDSALTQGFFIEKWPQYLAAIPNMRILVLNGVRKLHAKVAVFDGVAAFIGTYNLDYISARVNGEVVAVTYSEPFGRQVVSSILEDPAYASILFEYKIKRNADGSPVDADPATPEIEPEVEQGAKDHIPPELWSRYKLMRKATGFMQKVLPQLEPLF